MPDRIERVTSVTLTAAAVVLAVTLAHRELSGPTRPLATPAERVSNWTQVANSGIALGDSTAAVRIVEFADFECPYCKRFERIYRDAQQRFPHETSLSFVYLPLSSIHRFALPAARAAECARGQGRFAVYHDLLFEEQDSLGLISWESLARQAGVKDIAAFRSCVASSSSMPQVANGIALASKLNIHATPTLLINGWRVPAPGSDSSFDATVQAALRGEKSFEKFLHNQ